MKPAGTCVQLESREYSLSCNIRYQARQVHTHVKTLMFVPRISQQCCDSGWAVRWHLCCIPRVVLERSQSWCDVGGRKQLAGGLWRRAEQDGARTEVERRNYGIADDVYAAGLLLASLAFIPFADPGSIDVPSLQRCAPTPSLRALCAGTWIKMTSRCILRWLLASAFRNACAAAAACQQILEARECSSLPLQRAKDVCRQYFVSAVSCTPPCHCITGLADCARRLLESTFRLDVAAAREYCEADERWARAVAFLDGGGGGSTGWDLLAAMLNTEWRRRPTAESCLNHPFLKEPALPD